MADDKTSNGIPDAEAPATDSEKLRARSFGDLVDEMIGGGDAPALLEADQRELLDLATSLRAQAGDVELEAGRRDQLIEEAMARVIGAPVAPPVAAPAPPEVTSIETARRSRAARFAPWIAAAVVSAAAIALLVTRPAPEQRTVETVVERPHVAEQHLSRPADPLIGKIEARDADRASDRIDIIYADRMAGYRDLQLRGLRKGATP